MSNLSSRKVARIKYFFPDGQTLLSFFRACRHNRYQSRPNLPDVGRHADPLAESPAATCLVSDRYSDRWAEPLGTAAGFLLCRVIPGRGHSDLPNVHPKACGLVNHCSYRDRSEFWFGAVRHGLRHLRLASRRCPRGPWDRATGFRTQPAGTHSCYAAVIASPEAAVRAIASGHRKPGIHAARRSAV